MKRCWKYFKCSSDEKNFFFFFVDSQERKGNAWEDGEEQNKTKLVISHEMIDKYERRAASMERNRDG